MNKKLPAGIALILFSALLTAFGQLCWKIGIHDPLFILLGFLLYGFGALAMVVSFKFGEISILHPMMSMSYALSQILGYFILFEPVTFKKLAGIVLIMCGTVFLGLASRQRS